MRSQLADRLVQTRPCASLCCCPITITQSPIHTMAHPRPAKHPLTPEPPQGTDADVSLERDYTDWGRMKWRKLEETAAVGPAYLPHITIDSLDDMELKRWKTPRRTSLCRPTGLSTIFVRCFRSRFTGVTRRTTSSMSRDGQYAPL